MGDPDVASSDGNVSALSIWDREPELVSLEFVTWEHAASVPGSWGRAGRVADLRRLLPHDLTEPIYALLRQVETRFLRRTEPIPPLRERLARDFDVPPQAPVAEDGAITDSGKGFKLEGELYGLLRGAQTLGGVVPDWDARMAAALGTEAEIVARRVRNVAPLGLPTGLFSLSYGYRFDLRRIGGRLLGPALATHDVLLMGGRGPGNLQPGPLREFCDMLLR